MGEGISNTTTLKKYDKRLFLVTSQSKCHKDYLKESEDFSFLKNIINAHQLISFYCVLQSLNSSWFLEN